MRRREFFALLSGAVSLPIAVRAENSNRRPLIGVMATGSQSNAATQLVSGFPQGMRELGYVEGKDVEIVYRYADGDSARFSTLAEELVRLKPSVMVASNPLSALAVKEATTVIPIVVTTLGSDPVGLGLVANVA